MLKRRLRALASLGETSAFLNVSRRRRPELDALLLALAAQFRPVDERRALERLDEYGRHLFGLSELHPDGRPPACRTRCATTSQSSPRASTMPTA